MPMEALGSTIFAEEQKVDVGIRKKHTPAKPAKRHQTKILWFAQVGRKEVAVEPERNCVQKRCAFKHSGATVA